MRILVLRGGALGDFIVTLPALRRLRARWPAAHIELVGNATAGELGLLSGVLDAVHSQHEARWALLYADAASPLPDAFGAWLDGFDLVVSFWPDPEGDLRRRFAHRGHAFVAGSAEVDRAPAAKHFCDALAPLATGLDGLAETEKAEEYLSKISIPAPVHAEAARRMGSWEEFIALHPGSGSARKNWPLDRWRALVAERGERVLVVSGPADGAWSAAFAEDQRVHHAHDWPLPVLAAALSRARLFVGHDTGVSHLAAAVGTRCVLLFGPTDPAVWAPPGDQVRVLQNGAELSAIPVAAVHAAIDAHRDHAGRSRRPEATAAGS